MKTLISILALCLVASAMAKPNDSNLAVRAAAQSTKDFAYSFYGAARQAKSGNLVISPLNTALALAMAAYGARGNTEQQFKNVLHLPEDMNLGKSGFQELINDLNNVQHADLAIANKLFVSDKYTVKPSYKSLTESYFRSATESVNFGNTVQAAETINSWVTQQTRNLIKKIFNPSEIDPNTVVTLVSAMYFKGTWKVPFKKFRTRELPFHLDANTVKQVPTMSDSGSYRYAAVPSLDAKLIELPYKGDEFSMIIAVPNTYDGLAKIEEGFLKQNADDIFNQLSYQPVAIELPKFKLQSSIELNNVLQQLGLTEMFTNSADFSGMIENSVKISRVLQKAFIEVNEEGTEAAAVTGIGVITASAPIQTEVVKVDRPFYYVIRRMNDNVVLLNGRVVDPTKQ